MIGPDIPAELLSKRSTTSDNESEPEAGPSQPPSVGPVLPPYLLGKRRGPAPVQEAEDDDDDDDDYMPALPPDLDRFRPSAHPAAPKRVLGPSFPSIGGRASYADDHDDNDVGPMPLPEGYEVEEKDGVTEFLEKEERRRKQIEVRSLAFCF
jgi:hypothetical protein